MTSIDSRQVLETSSLSPKLLVIFSFSSIWRTRSAIGFMGYLIESATSAFSQLLAVFILSFLVYLVHRFVSKNGISPFSSYVGLKRAAGQFDKQYWVILFAVVSVSMICTYLQFSLRDRWRVFLTGDTSPYGKILKNGFNGISIAAGALYCFAQAAGSEELLFRGLISRRLFDKFGATIGNLIQSLIFWLMHLAIIRLVTGNWFSWIQLHVFLFSFGFGLLLGFVNFRKRGTSIAPSWFLHGFTNFATFLLLGFLWG